MQLLKLLEYIAVLDRMSQPAPHTDLEPKADHAQIILSPKMGYMDFKTQNPTKPHYTSLHFLSFIPIYPQYTRIEVVIKCRI